MYITMKRKTLLMWLMALCLLAPSTYAEAKVALPHFVTDSMVVQQNSVWTIKGRADGPSVTARASWGGKAVTVATQAGGRFSLQLPTPKAGGPYTVSLSDGEPTVLRDVFVGEVWLCSGQSNMEMPLGGWGKVMDYEREIATASNSSVRLLQISNTMAFTPQEDVGVEMGGWRTCSPSTVEDFSAVAYFFARIMAARLGVHVGVIDCTWGGTPAEAWTSFEGVNTVPGFAEELGLLTGCGFDAARIDSAYNSRLMQWRAQALASGGKGSVRVLADGAPALSEPIATGLPVMAVPGQWESGALPSFDGMVRLRKVVDIPDGWSGRPVTLSLGCIDDEDVTYFNGVKIAQGSGYNVRRSYVIPGGMVKGGAAVVTVCVTDYEGEGGICGDARDVAMSCGGDTVSLAGGWEYEVFADFGKLPRKPVSPSGSSFPTVLYNAMVCPIVTMPVKGVLWYQGCSNVGRAEQYSPLFRRLISDWREMRHSPDMPFYFVQLSAYLKPSLVQPESGWAALRQAQADALSLDNTAMAVTIDIGDSAYIHPKNKQEVARRLSLIALKRSYGVGGVVDTAPVPVSCRYAGGAAELEFDGNIVVDGSRPQGFIVKTAAGQWVVPAVTVAGKRTLRLSADGGIEAVRYNWADYPLGNLRGETGLPVAQFAR